jgi:NAD(P)H-hydrate epimerase
MTAGGQVAALAPLLTRAQSRAVDVALGEAEVPGVLLMENAGRGSAEVIATLAVERGVRRATVLVGPGNNGGDGLVVARHLVLAGLEVDVLSLGDPGALRGDAAVMRDAWYGVGGSIEIAGARPGDADERVPLPGELVVDALFGTGLSRPLDGLARALVRRANLRAERALSIALDIPSGLDADTGAALGSEDVVFRATHTLTFGTGKPGLYTGFGRRASGEVRVLHLGAPLPAAVVGQARAWLVASAGRLAPRSLDAHKGDNGRVLVVGGSAGMTGAALLAARGAHRAGAGLVTIASRAAAAIDGKVVETMSLPLPDDASAVGAVLQDVLARADAVVVGPGLGRDPWAEAVLDAALAHAPRLVVDGDALGLLGARARPVREAVRVLTPHPLEMARLLGRPDAAAINADRLGAAREGAARYQAVVVLKGAGSVVAMPDGRAFVIDCAAPALGVAGSGDVLAGVIAARLAEHHGAAAVVDRVLEAVLAHGRAGERVRRARGATRGALASEIADHIGAVLEGG